MQDLQVFSFQGASEVRTVVQDGEPYFVGKDVATLLGYSNPQKAIRDHCKNAVPVGVNESFTLDPQTIVIPERDLYRLVMRSKLPTAEVFEEWVVGEVLPSIRKTGGYTLQRAPQTYIEALEAYVASEKARIAAEEQAALELQRANELSDEVEQLSEVVDELFGYSSILRIAKYNNVSEKGFSWRALKKAAISLNLDIKTVPCPRFETKKLYPHEAWEACYPDMKLPDRASTTLTKS